MPRNNTGTKSLQAPSVRDYLPRTISKKVYSRGVTHPLTLYPLAIGAGMSVTGFLFNMPMLYVGAAAGFFTGAVCGVSMIFFMHDKIGKKYIAELNRRQKNYEQYIKRMLKKELAECLEIDGAETYATQGREHFDMIGEKLSNVQEILDLKIEESELTYDRFMGAADQVVLSVLDNLKDVVTTLKSAGSIDVGYIHDKLANLEHLPDGNDKEMQEGALLKRLALRNSQFEKVTALLTKNEVAMTEMENISAAVSEWQTDDSFAEVDFESAISRLQELAEQAHVYNNR